MLYDDADDLCMGCAVSERWSRHSNTASVSALSLLVRSDRQVGRSLQRTPENEG